MAETGRFTSGSLTVKHGLKGSTVIAHGTVTLDGTNPTPVDCLAVHGIGTVKGAIVCMNDATAPGADTNNVTVAWTGSTLNAYAWKVTTGGAAGNPTEIASTNSTKVVSYLVWGTV